MRARVFLALLLVAGCRAAPELEPIPYPEIDELEEQVRGQLGAARAALDRQRAAEVDAAELARLFGETGMLYHAYDLRQAAAACYRNAARLAPAEFRWPFYLGHVYVGAGDLDRGRLEFERALAIRPEDTSALVRLARLELEQDRLERAQSLFLRVLELDANNAAARVGLGKIASAGGDFDTAVRHFEAALVSAPQATKIHHPLGLAYRGLGQIEKAESVLSRRGEVPVPFDDPWMREIGALVDGMRVHQIQGTIYFKEGQYEQALTEFRRAVEEDPGEPLVRTNLALTLIQLGDTQGAERELQEALRLDPTDAFAHYNYGTLLTNLDRDAAAVEHFQAAIERDPGQLRAHLNLANVLTRLGRPAEALAHYRTVVEGDPGSDIARIAEARALARLGRWTETRRRLEEAYTALPENVSIRFDLARVLAAAPEDGVRDGKRAIALTQPLVTPKMPLAQIETVAMIAAENGLFESALEMQQRAIESVRSAGRDELLPVLARNLARYQNRQACREPWPAG